jgi:uncharacterized coiled-coil protein SlyX
MDIVTNLSTAISLAKRLREISKNIEEAEFKNVLAELMSELADAKLDAASLKEKLAALMEENLNLKSHFESAAKSALNPPSGTKHGLYYWEDDESLYCTACWDSKSAKSRVTSINRAGIKWLCPVCKAYYG